MEPEQVPIIRPSSRVMPIDVQAERPASTATCTEQPLPRCATTSARSEDGMASSSAARAMARSTDSPWKPNRRRPSSSVHEAGRGYVNAGGASVAWNGRVEGGHLVTPGSATSATRISLNRDRVVEQGEVGEAVQLIEHHVVDERRGA